MTREQMKESLESLVDRAPDGIEDVLAMLSEICSDKAEHLRDNWQDKESAKYWIRMSNRIEAAR